MCCHHWSEMYPCYFLVRVGLYCRLSKFLIPCLKSRSSGGMDYICAAQLIIFVNNERIYIYIIMETRSSIFFNFIRLFYMVLYKQITLLLLYYLLILNMQVLHEKQVGTSWCIGVVTIPTHKGQGSVVPIHVNDEQLRQVQLKLMS